LEKAMVAFLNVYSTNNLDGVLTKADFFHLASALAVEFTSDGQVPLSNTWLWGRTECPYENPSFPKRLPAPTDKWQRLVDVFITRLGLTVTDVVALNGAHCLGSVRLEEALMMGAWVPNNTRFSNAFYKRLFGTYDDSKWTLDTPPYPNAKSTYYPPSFVGHETATSPMMLPTDLSMGWNSDSGCNVTRQPGDCPVNTNTQTIAKNFAQDESAFFSSFCDCIY